MRCIVLALVCACDHGVASPAPETCDQWLQWGNGPAHDGRSCAAGQPLAAVLADIVIDPFVADEQADVGGDLAVHYQVPLVADDHAFLMEKRGTYTRCAPVTDPTNQVRCFQPQDATRLSSQGWAETRYDWIDGELRWRWTFDSDWKPPPYNETMFQPAVVGAIVAVPGAHGSLWELDAETGAIAQHVEPFSPEFTPDVYVAGALATNGESIYYNAIDRATARGWLVEVAFDSSTRVASYDALVPSAPRATDLCYGNYAVDPKHPTLLPPLDRSGNVIPPPQAPCGSQLPGANAAPAVAADGTIYVATHAAYNESYSFIVAIDSATLTPRWAASLRDRLRDGCGLWARCTPGAPIGVDPSTGQLPAGMVDDMSSSSPVALPHGGVIYGALTFYNAVRGHLMAFDADGHYIDSYGFGWDTTPAIASDGARDRIVLKDNHYIDNATPGPYYITELDAMTMQPVWQLANTETKSCYRQPDGTMSCSTDHPNGFEWCVNAPAIDVNGTIFANSEDGNLYSIASDGTLLSRVFLVRPLGASYTPVSLDPVGRVYSLNNGHVVVVGLASGVGLDPS